MSISSGNIFHLAGAALRWRLFGRRRPVNVMLAVTDRCDSRCAMCRIPELNRPEMSLAQIQTILGDAAAFGCQRLGLWGGEPLLRDDLGAIIAAAKRLGLFVTVDTNGHRLPESDERLAGVDHLNISLDGDRAAHDAVRGPGSFDKTMRGLEHAGGRYRFWTLTVLTRANLDQVDWLLRLARERKFFAAFQVLHHNDLLGCNEPWRPDPRELRETVRLLLARKREGWPIASSRRYLEHLLDWPDFRAIRSSEPRRRFACAAGALYCNVDVNGDVYPCSLLIGERPAPSAVALGFRAAFARLAAPDCRQCLAACFTEYNQLFTLDWDTGWNWVSVLRR